MCMLREVKPGLSVIPKFDQKKVGEKKKIQAHLIVSYM